MWNVYKHTNKINNKCYIGITSQDPVQRWGNNGNKYTHHTKFWPAIQKYGWNNFTHEVLYTGLTKEEACQKEQELIKFYDSYNNGYNASLGGESGSNGCNKEPQNRQKIKEGMKKFLQENPEALQRRINQLLSANQENRVNKIKEYYADLSPEERYERQRKRFKKVQCIETGEIFESVKKAAIWCNRDPGSVTHCLKGDTKTCAGYHWRYIE